MAYDNTINLGASSKQFQNPLPWVEVDTTQTPKVSNQDVFTRAKKIQKQPQLTQTTMTTQTTEKKTNFKTRNSKP